MVWTLVLNQAGKSHHKNSLRLEDLKALKSGLEPRSVIFLREIASYKLSFWHDKIWKLIVPLELFEELIKLFSDVIECFREFGYRKKVRQIPSLNITILNKKTAKNWWLIWST